MPASSTPRSAAMDALRAAAVLRVVCWHLTGWVGWTYVAAIPVMFALTGHLLASSTHTAGAAWPVVRTRLRRLVGVFWPFATAVVVVGVAVNGTAWLHRPDAASWILPLTTPPGFPAEGGWATAPLWYIRTYVHCVLLWPVVSRVARRWPVRAVAAHACALVALHVAAPEGLRGVHELLLCNAFLLAGAATYHIPAVLDRARLRRCSFGMTLAGFAVLRVLQPPPSGAVNDVPLLHALLGTATLLLVLEMRGRAAAFRAAPVHRFAAFLATKSLTVYLWHAPLFALYVHLTTRVVPTVPSPAVALAAAGSMFATLPALAVFERRLWWRRPAALWVGRRSAMLALPMSAVVVLVTVATPSVSTAQVLTRTPSKAPTAAAFDAADSPLLLASTPASAAPASPAAPPAPGVTAPPATQRIPDRHRVAPTPATVAPPATTPKVDPTRMPAALVHLNRFADTSGAVEVYVRFEDGTTMGFAADRGSAAQPIPLSNRFEVFSIAKSFTAALLLRAAADGRVDLDAPIGALPTAPTFTAPKTLTVRHLLNHRSGLANYMDADVLAAAGGSIDTPAALFTALGSVPLRFAPGTKQVYSSTNFVLAGMVVADVYGAPYETVLRREILDPLALSAIEAYPPQRNAPGTGTGNMRATAEDLLRWGSLMWGSKSVLDATGNVLAAAFDQDSLMGPGSFAFCPCARPTPGTTTVAARGMNGVDLTLRVYTAGVTVLLRTPNRQLTPAADRVLTEMVSTLITG